MSIAHHIREIGRGKDGTRSLTQEEAHDLMSQVMAGHVSELEIGAFAVAMRIKGESLAELTGFLAATHVHCVQVPIDRPTVVIPSYNGARRLPNLTPLLAVLLARRGVQVLVHGTTQSAGRITSSAIFHELGWPVARHVEAVQQAWQRHDPVFMAIDDVCAPLARLLAVREVIGLRNSGHTLAKLLLPVTGARALRLVNYTHPDYAELLRKFMAEGAADALLMRGTEGEPVADSRRPTPMEFHVAGQIRADLVAQTTADDTAPPGMPRSPDAPSTIRYTLAVLRDEQRAPAAILNQVEGVVRAFAAMAQAPDRAHATGG